MWRYVPHFLIRTGELTVSPSNFWPEYRTDQLVLHLMRQSLKKRIQFSAREHRRLMQKSVVVDLLDEEIRHIGPRDETACPVARID